MLSGAFSEGKIKDLRSSFPLDQPTELDDHHFLDDGDLEDVEDDAKLPIEIPDATSENRNSPLKGPIFALGFTSTFLPQITRLWGTDSMPSVCATRSMDPGTHLGKVVVLRDISFVT